MFVCADGGLLCKECVLANLMLVLNAVDGVPEDNQWRIIGAITGGGRCDHCYKEVEADDGDGVQQDVPRQEGI